MVNLEKQLHFKITKNEMPELKLLQVNRVGVPNSKLKEGPHEIEFSHL
jgi:hypothetical protein